MHRVKMYREEIIKSGDSEKISKMMELDDKGFCTIKDKDYEMAKWLSSEYREIARGTELDEEMIRSVLPTTKWSVEDTNNVKSMNGWMCDDNSFNYMANYFYNKFGEKIGEENVLMMAHIESPHAYHYWKIQKMLKK